MPIFQFLLYQYLLRTWSTFVFVSLQCIQNIYTVICGPCYITLPNVIQLWFCLHFFFLSFCSNVKKYSQWEWQKIETKHIHKQTKLFYITQNNFTQRKRSRKTHKPWNCPTHASYEHHCVYFYTECCQCLLSSVYLISSDKKNTGFIQGTHALSDSMSTQRSNSVVTIEIYILISDTAYMMI